MRIIAAMSAVVMMTQGPTITAASGFAKAHLQFLGDVYLPEWVLELTKTTPLQPRLFEHMQALLASSDFNIVNLEAVATDAFMKIDDKTYHLRMPLETVPILKAAGINVATLANNHTMDFGSPGLFDLTYDLKRYGIAFGGAGFTLDEALRPIYLHAGGRSVCLLSFSRTLPESFWATEQSAGTAGISFGKTVALVAKCAKERHLTIVSFHWGRELAKEPQAYQTKLAHLVADAGADLVIGHHPHVVQPMEIYNKTPIFYSIGNFAFGTLPSGKRQEGMSVRLRIEGSKLRIDIVPLAVASRDVKFKPRPVPAEASGPMAFMKSFAKKCPMTKDGLLWSCIFTLNNSTEKSSHEK